MGQHDYEFQEIVKRQQKKFVGNKLQIRLLMYRNSVQISTEGEKQCSLLTKHY